MLMPSFLITVSSVTGSIQLPCASHPNNSLTLDIAFAAVGFVTAPIDNAINISSNVKKSYFSFKSSFFIFKIGSIVSGEIKFISSLMFASSLIAFSSTAEDAESKLDFLPVTILPFGSSNATTGTPQSLDFSLAITATFLSSGVIPKSPIKSSIFSFVEISPLPCK